MADLAQGQTGSWWIIYRSTDGIAMSETGDAPDTPGLTAVGLAAALQTHRPDPLVEMWDQTTRTLVPRTAPTRAWVAPPANSSYKLLRYEVLDNPAGIQATFFGPLPGGILGEVVVIFLDTELATVTTQSQMGTLARSKLGRKLRVTGLATQLDGLIGQSLVV